MKFTASFARGTLRALIVAALLFPAGFHAMLPRTALATSSLYEFTRLAFLGDPAPGGGEFTFDFETYGLNNPGEASFGADVTTGGEGVFVARDGQLSEIARSGQPAPGGGTFGFFGFFGAIPINDPGDVAFVFALRPLRLPFGLNAGLYRFSHHTRMLEAVVVPEVTPAPGGGVFAGVGFSPKMNNRGDIAFNGALHGADIAPGPPGVDGLGLGFGAFVADRHGRISNVASPGDVMPGGGRVDVAGAASINDHGDIVFHAHIDGEPCIEDPFAPQTVDIGCLGGNAYLKRAATGEIELIQHQEAPAPGGGICRYPFGSRMNNRREIAFSCDLTPAPGLAEVFGLFFRSHETTVTIARPGDPMPGGGNLLRAGAGDSLRVNNRGEVTFTAVLDTNDIGLYVWSRGSLRLVARSGTVIPGVGTIVAVLQTPDFLGTTILPPPIGANDRGQILFPAVVNTGGGNLRGVLVLATPQSVDAEPR